MTVISSNYTCPVCQKDEAIEVTVRITPGVGRYDFEEEITEQCCPLTDEQREMIQTQAYEDVL